MDEVRRETKRVSSEAARPDTDVVDMTTSQPASSAQPVKPTIKPAAAGFAEQPTPAISVSETLWNAAYDSLETDDAELVGSYVKTLEEVLGETAATADLSAKLKDPTMRIALGLLLVDLNADTASSFHHPTPLPPNRLMSTQRPSSPFSLPAMRALGVRLHVPSAVWNPSAWNSYHDQS